MISRTLAEKTLLDLGDFELDKELSDELHWMFFYVSCPEITLVLHWPDKAARLDSVALEVVFPELQTAVYESFLDCRGDNGIEITSRKELEDVVTTMKSLLQKHLEWCERAASGDEFDPGFDEPDDDMETEAVRRIRLGQTIYRRGLERLWDGRCAVTGIGVRELLRASHAKPWAECETGTERICPFNGFLLLANLDALFDKFVISFDDEGKILIASGLSQDELAAAGVTSDLRLRFVRAEHLPYLHWHRQRFERCQTQTPKRMWHNSFI